ncbi:MAG: glycoside hydrolase family 127 protein [Verrucomicrobiales bacterium]|nr:glycoside hydrolase family 127 protein [Verrucomicrobiales bacterium]
MQTVFRTLFAVLTWLAVPTATRGESVRPLIPDVARPLPLSSVRITGGPLKRAQDLDAQYLLELEPDRMLAGYRLRAGLEPRARGYGGWDSVEGKQLTGHIAGHYLSAVSLMFAATGDVRFRARADYVVEELRTVQEARGNGYLGALTDKDGRDAAAIFEEVARGNIRSGGFDLNGMWSPWYTLHKTYAGLRDAWRFAGNQTALELEIRFAAWAEGILCAMSDDQTQRMLNTEFGGMNEVFVDLYEDTGDRRWLDLSQRFEHRSFTEPFMRHQDNLPGKHGNTQVPKLIGSLDRFALTGDVGDGLAAAFFWDCVVQHHSYATGGHGKDEYFGEPDQLSERVDGRTAETCNVYNMLKLTRRLSALRPDAHYADFLERALFNHILASIDPEDGRTCYMVPVGRGVEHEYQDMFRSFTCCVGSGMESHALHGDGIYAEAEGKLWVHLFVPSTFEAQGLGVRGEMTTGFPEGGSANLRLTVGEPREFTLAVRRPSWAGEGFGIRVNGEPVNVDEGGRVRDGGGGRRSEVALQRAAATGSYVELRRRWRDGDEVSVVLPKALHVEPLPDNPRRVAILWGPLVLAGDLGPEPDRGAARIQAPVFVAAERPVEEWLKPVEGRSGWFRTVGVGKEREVEFAPFYRLHRRLYGVYWDLFTPSEWEIRAAELAAGAARQRRLEAATVAYAQPGEMQPERDFNQQGENTAPTRVMGRAGRRGGGWFSFDLPVDPAHPMALVVTYNEDEWRRRTFDILVDGERIAQQVIEDRGPLRFFDVEYPLRAALVAGKTEVTVRFEATGGNEIAGVFGLRMIRADAER